MKCCTKCCVYASFILNFIWNFLILFCACISTRNTKKLNDSQKFLLSLWIIIYIINTLWPLVKFILLIIKKLEYHLTYKLDLIVNFSGMGIYGISMIYDLVLIGKKEIKCIIYQLFLWIGILLYVLFAFIAHFKLDDACLLILHNSKEKQMNEDDLIKISNNEILSS